MTLLQELILTLSCKMYWYNFMYNGCFTTLCILQWRVCFYILIVKIYFFLTYNKLVAKFYVPMIRSVTRLDERNIPYHLPSCSTIKLGEVGQGVAITQGLPGGKQLHCTALIFLFSFLFFFFFLLNCLNLSFYNPTFSGHLSILLWGKKQAVVWSLVTYQVKLKHFINTTFLTALLYYSK